MLYQNKQLRLIDQFIDQSYNSLRLIHKQHNLGHMEHIHGPDCGCQNYVGVENANDLLATIDIDKIVCLNERVSNSGKKIFKLFENRFDKEKIVVSDADGELLLIVPFTCQVKVRSVCVISKREVKYPNRLRLYVNKENVDFSLTQESPAQEFPLTPNLDGSINHAVNINKFKGVYKLIIHLINESQEQIEVSYIQIKGQSTNIKRQPVTTVYEVQPSAQKKDLKDLQKNTFQMG